MDKKPTPKFEPGVAKFLDEELTKEIRVEHKTTTAHVGYKPPRIRYPEIKMPPKTIFSPTTWSKYNMEENFDFIQIIKNAGLADQNGRLIFRSTPTATIKEVLQHMLVNFKAVKILIKSIIIPKSKMKLEKGNFFFSASDIKPFILYHFPADAEEIKTVNASNLMKHLLDGLENNPVRQNKPIGLLIEHSTKNPNDTKSKIMYQLDEIITKFSFDQLHRIMSISLNKPHCRMDQYSAMIDDILTQKPEDIIKHRSKSWVGSEYQGLDISDEPIRDMPQRVERELDLPAQKNTDLNSEDDNQIINIKALNKIMNPGDTIEITIKYTKSSVGE